MRLPAPRLNLLIVLLASLLLCTLRIGPAFTAAGDDPDRVFLGFPYSIEDTLQYADFAAQARDHGSLFFSNRFTLDDEDPRLVILPLYLTGRLADALGLSVAGAWTLVQALMIAAFVWMLYWFLGAFFPSPGSRLFACLFVLFAGGLDGWVVLAGGLWPEVWAAALKKNLWTVLGWTPYMTMYNPVYLAGWLVLLPWLRLAMAGLSDRRRWQYSLAAAGLLPVMYLVHAYDAVVAAAALALVPLQALLVRMSGREFVRALKPVGLALAGVLPVAALAIWQAGDPLFARVAGEGRSGLFVSPVFWTFGFGGILLAACYGLRRMCEHGPRAALLFGWLAAASALSFSPLLEGRHFLYFVSLPLGIAAVDGLVWLNQRFALSRRGLIAVALIGALVCGNSLVRTTVRAFAHTSRDDRMFVTRDELRVARELRKLPPGGVLASRNTGNWLPHLSDHRAVMGHWFLTWDMASKVGMFHRLVDPGTSPAERDLLLRRFGARYLFWGPRESALGSRPATDQVRLLPLQRFGNTFLLEIQLTR